MLANNIAAIIHLFQYNKYQISTFLLEPLARKLFSISFVTQYISSVEAMPRSKS